MSSVADQRLLEALAALAAVLRSLEAPSMVIGGIAVIAHGVPRLTVDIDATVWSEEVELERLLPALARHGIEPRIRDALDFARRRQVLLLEHQPSGTPLEITLASLPFEREALARAAILRVAGVEVSIVSAEDLVVYKAVAWRERDRSDLEELLALHGSTMNLERVRRLVREFAEVLDDPGRVAAFEEIVARVSS
ncbi:MAG TPA: nucleotidyltransferase [Thermoanaerobaculia bacterium]|nr:nucleotidyltransferase [Thermoanaerobaculia bacterium]